MNVFKMASRNVWRNKRRTLVTVAAMSLALLVMTLYSGLVKGYLEGSERNLLELELGDIQIHDKAYADDPSIYSRMGDADAVVARLRKAGLKASARLLAAGLAAVGEVSAGATFIGIDVARDREVSRIYENVLEGKWLAAGDDKGVVIGRRLARNLNAKVGDELVVLSQGWDGSMANELYTVRGILKAVTDAVDRSGIFMTEGAYRSLMVVDEGAHRIIVRKPDAMPLQAALAAAKQAAPDHDVKTWRELVPTLASMMDSIEGVMYTMYFIVFLAIGIVILNAMLMAVFERIREFGVLKAVGVGPLGVLRLILLEGAIQTGLAIVVGMALAIPGLWFLSEVGIDMSRLGGISIQGIVWDPIWRASVDPSTFTGPVFTLVFVVGAALLYPAVKAALISPVKAIHHQ